MLSRPRAERFPGVIGTFMARDALSLAATYLELGPDDVVLLPAYLCKEVLRPFLGRNRVRFYDVGGELTIDPDALRELFKTTDVRLLVIINYFGVLQPFRREIAALCAERGTILLEDCAHSLLTEGSGQTGDLCVFSFRKTLPVVDGGGLKITKPLGARPVHFYPRFYSNVLSSLALAKSLLNVQSEVLSRAGMADLGPTAGPPEPVPANGNRRVLPLSSFAYNGIGHVSLADIVERRRRDYRFWQSFAKETGAFTPLFSELGAGVCPLGFAAQAPDRDLVRGRLERFGVAVKVHWRLQADLGRECVNSHRLSQELMTLPVYPELTARTREVLQDSLPGWRSR